MSETVDVPALMGLLEKTLDDHKRGCAGRECSCTCGYERAADEFIAAARTAIPALIDQIKTATATIKSRRLSQPGIVWEDEAHPGNHATSAQQVALYTAMTGINWRYGISVDVFGKIKEHRFGNKSD